jgi:hypothetical protein
MSKTVSFEIPDEIYELLQTVAGQMGLSTEEVALEWLARLAPKPRPKLTEEERQAAWQRLQRHAGAVDSGDPHSADNDRIDADLIREYADPHEETS